MDRSTPATGFQTLIDAIDADDVGAVAESIALPPMARLTEAERRLYAERVVVGSKLYWALQQKLGEREAGQMRMRADLGWVGRIDPVHTVWEIQPADTLKELGAQEIAFARANNSPAINATMVRVASDGQWRLHRLSPSAVLLLLQLDDAPGRNPTVRRVLADVQAGRLASTDAVALALIPQVPTTRPGDRSTPEGTIATLAAALQRGDVRWECCAGGI